MQKAPSSVEDAAGALPRDNHKRLLDKIEETSEKMRKELVQRLEGQREVLLELRLRCLETKKSFSRVRASVGGLGLDRCKGSRHRKGRKQGESVAEEWDDTPLVLMDDELAWEVQEESGGGRSKSSPVLSLDLTKVPQAELP